jgi:hypothetical protein
VVLLLSLLAIPALMGLALVLEWLERVFAQQEAASEIARLIEHEAEIEQLEQRVAQVAESFFTR